MFYSETLLAKTGPLATPWLSANQPKLAKSKILQANIPDIVNQIVDPRGAPMALRLTGHLLLGTVRLYKGKAGYLLVECNEALHKIKMTFRRGNVDLPANQTSAANVASITLEDRITELDIQAPMDDPSLLLSPHPYDDIFDRPDPSLLDFASSQQLPSSIGRARRSSTPFRPDDDVGLQLDLGNDIGTPAPREREIEFGRDAPPSRSLADDLNETMKLDDDDLELDLGEEDEPIPRRESTVLPDIGNTDFDQDYEMGGMGDDFGHAMPEENVVATSAPLQRERERDSLSPLSSIRSSVERDLEQTFQDRPASVVEHDDEASVHHAQRAKRRKVLQPDADTEIHSNQIRAQQNDRSKILKPVSYIPSDPVLLTLMNMQRNGEFVSNILSDGRSRGWAPELRGILSLELIRTPAPLKRKRDIAANAAVELPQFQLEPEDEDELVLPGADFDIGADTTFDNGEMLNLPADDGPAPFADDDVSAQFQSRAPSDQGTSDEDLGANNFDDTAGPDVHPADNGPISIGTKHAVHLLRERFNAAGADATPSKRAKASVLFQELLPERNTTRADATKMFFEVLVLATKDAIKVEQASDALGAPLRLRGKRGLWGAWAETEAGGEIDGQEGEYEEEGEREGAAVAV